MFSKNQLAPKSSFALTERKDLIGFSLHFYTYLEKKYGVISEYLLNDEGLPRCLYFQDSFMKDWFNFFPDRLCIDVTHKYVKADTLMFLFIAEDSNGKNEIVSLGFSMSGYSESLVWVLNTFKKHNPNWRRTKVIVSDSEIQEREVVRNSFSCSYMLICFYHAFKSFKKALENLQTEYGFPPEQMETALNLFKSMYLTRTQAEYELYYQQFLILHSSIVSYFQDAWSPIQYLWRIELDCFRENIFGSLSFYLDVLGNTLKAMLISENNLVEFVKKAFTVFNLKRNEKVNIVQYTNPLLFSRFSPEHQISKTLTPYAAKFVIDQYDLSCDILMNCSLISDSYYFDNFGSPANASATVCSCRFYSYTLLPCKHIFAVRKALSLCIFDETITEYSWSMKYYQSTIISMQGGTNIKSVVSSETSLVQKISLVSNLMESALPLVNKSPESVFESQIKQLNQLISFWQNGKNVYLQFDGVEKVEPCVDANCKNDKYQKFFFSEPIECKTETYTMEDNLIKKDRNKCSEPSGKGNKKRKWNFKSQVLNGRYINYAYLCRVICESKTTCFNWLKQMELIPICMMCPSCNCEMVVKNMPRLSDGAAWVCSNVLENKRTCFRRCSVRQGSWFELTNMTFEQILIFCYLWIKGFSQSQIIFETGISSATYASWNNLNKRVCEECLLEENYISKGDSSMSVVETWLEACGDDDAFLKFLQDSNTMHRKDSIRHIMR